jgi:uncharacterized membrane protein YdbT with pleckstrin-like domain
MNDKNSDQPTGAPATNDSTSRPETEPDYTKPVAYDNQGRPLYAHPPEVVAQPVAQTAAPEVQEPTGEHKYVHIRRSMDPEEQDIPPAVMERYEASRRQFPNLNLSKGEYIISAVKRHPIGLLQIWLVAFVLIGALLAVLANFLAENANTETVTMATVGLGLVSVLIMLGAVVATMIYNANRFYLTNESVIQEIQVGLFNKHEQTVSLNNIEDASFYQMGVVPHLLNYGTIRLSTEGDETTYRFSYVADPKRHIAVLNNAVEAFKNGRPVDEF